MQFIEGLLPYSSILGDLTLPKDDDGFSEEIKLETDVVLFDFDYNCLYVSYDNILCVHVLGTCACVIKHK